MAGRRDDELKLPSYMNRKVEGSKRASAASPSNDSARERAADAERAQRLRQEKENIESERIARERAAAEDAAERAAARAQGARREEKERSTRTPSSCRRPQRPARRIRGGRIALLLLAVAIVIGGAVFFINRGDDGGQLVIGQSQRLPEGVSVLGLDVGGETKTAARNAIEQKADKLLEEAMVTIRADGEEYKISGADVSLAYDIEAVLQRAMQFDPATAGVVNVATASANDKINDVFTWNSRALELALENIAAGFDVEPVEATAEATEGADHSVTFAFSDGRAGRKLNAEATVQYIEAQFASGSYTFDIDATFENIEPTYTAAELRQNITLRASYTTQFPISNSDETVKGRVFNIEKAAGLINGCVVQPDEEWSFNGFVGLRTYESGWKAANGIADGKEYVLQAGGGICQVSSTLYNALLCADVEVTDRRAHTIPSTYVPKGLDATVDSTGIDLKFKNDTGEPLFLFAYIADGSDDHHKTVTFNIYGASLGAGISYKTRSEVIDVIDRQDEVNYTDDMTIPRGYKVVKVEARDGYKVEAYRDKYVNGQKTETELLYTDSYRGNAEVALRGAASPKYYTAPENAVKMD